jgi:hypothetical protein
MAYLCHHLVLINMAESQDDKQRTTNDKHVQQFYDVRMPDGLEYFNLSQRGHRHSFLFVVH